jgi:hypothetical protein
MFIVSDRVRETSSSVGSGSVVLSGPYGAFQSFSGGIGDGNTTYYAIENNDRWEVGQGVYSLGSDSISRDVIFDSSASGSKIELAGTSVVFCTLPADKAFIKDPNDNVLVNDIVSISEGNINDLTVNTLSVSGQANFGSDATVSGDLTVLGDLNFSFGGNIVANNITATGHLVSSGFLTLVRPNSAGNFFHAYKDDGTKQTVSLYVDSNISPLWRLGLKVNPNDQTASPTFGYVYGRDGSVGLVGNTANYLSLADSAGYNLRHDTGDIFTASRSDGVEIQNIVPAAPVFTVDGGVLATEDLQRWQNQSLILSVVDSGGKFGILMDTPIYEVDVNGSGRMDTIYLTSGIFFQDGTFQDSASVGGGGSGTTFDGDLLVSLAGGKSFGRYLDGETIPASGLTAAAVIELSVVEPIDPTVNLSATPATIETGTAAVSVTLNFSYTINNPGESVSSVSLEFRRGGAGSWTVLSTDTGLTTFNHNFANASADQINYRYIVIDTAASTDTATDNVNFSYTVFYGPSSSVPVTSANVRALPSTRFLSAADTFNLNTGSTEVNFSVAMPDTESISEVLDLDALSANITSEYVNNAFNVDDAGGNPIAYNVYTMTVGIPYSSDHRHQVTKG